MQVFLKVWRTFYRQGSNLFFCVLFPTVLTFLLGSLLAGMDNAEYSIGTVRAGYVAGGGPEGEFLEAFLQGLEQVEASSFEKEDEALYQLREGLLDVVCRYDAQSGEILLYEGANAVKSRAAQNMLQGYAAMEGAVKTAYAVPGLEGGYVKSKDLGVTRSMMDYYAVAMLVMIIFMGGLNGSTNTFYEDRRGNTFTRSVLSPAGKTKMFLEVILGLMPMVFIQVLTVMVCSTVFFGARYCDRWQDNVFLACFFILICVTLVAFGSLIGLFIRRHPMIFVMPVLWVMMLLSGTFSKEIYVEGISERMPMYQIQKAAFDLTVFGRHELALRVMGVYAAGLVVCLFLGSLIYNWKKG